jgi:glycogen operon protein
LGATIAGFGDESDLHVIANMYWEPLEFQLPVVPTRNWHRVVDTARPSPEDILLPGDEVPLVEHAYRAEGRSVVIFEAK